MIELKIKLDRRFDGAPPGKAEAAKKLAAYAAKLLKERIEEEGKDHQGRPLPAPKSRCLMLPIWSPLVSRLPTDGRMPYKRPGSSGKPTWYLWRRPYVELKTALGGKPWRGSSFSGDMWKRLSAVIKPGNSVSGIEIRLRFAGSVRVIGKNGPTRFQNRDKAYWTQFSKRAGNTGAPGRIAARREDSTGAAPTTRDFALMQFSRDELGALTRFWLEQVQLFAPR
jgi:hypothetical protein